MEFLLFSLGAHATFPGLVSDALPRVLSYPTVGVGVGMEASSYASVEVGALTVRTGQYSVSLLTSTLYFGTFIRSYDLAVGYTVSGVGINTLSIEDQGYMGITFKGGYVKRFGRLSTEGGLVLPVYLMTASGKVGVLPVPLLYLNLSYGR